MFILCDLSFCSALFLRFIHFACSCKFIHFSLLYRFHCVNTSLLTHSSADRLWGCFQLPSIVSSATWNIPVTVLWCICIFFSRVCIPGNEIAGHQPSGVFSSMGNVRFSSKLIVPVYILTSCVLTNFYIFDNLVGLN